MIITRTPFRITLGGGGTDLPGFYSRHGGFVLSAALNKYMFIYLNTPIVDDLVRVKYSKSEMVEDVSELQHTLCREALRLFGIRRAIEVISMADRSEEHTSELQSLAYLVCRLLLEKKK